MYTLMLPWMKIRTTGGVYLTYHTEDINTQVELIEGIFTTCWIYEERICDVFLGYVRNLRAKPNITHLNDEMS